ncbi:MAG: protein-L-isoaspartate(D-aspartate) O-methyltransferase [Candidatus Nanopelagicales bacterium]
MTASELVAALRRQGISDPRVLAAMSTVPRDEFVPPDQKPYAWEDRPLPIGAGQTVSQPFVVAYTIQMLRLPPGSAVLDVGTGCGYQAAVLAECGLQVSGVEIRSGLAERAQATLSRLGYAQVHVTTGDGRQGMPERAPFDGIVVAAASRDIPAALVSQLRNPGGRLIMPLGHRRQRLVLVEPAEARPRVTDLLAVAFVPLL